MARLRINQEDISDLNLFKIASLGCLPASEWLIFRESHYFGKKKQTLNEYVKKVRKIFQNKGIKGLQHKYSIEDLTLNSLTKWHPFLLKLPLRCLVNPLNGEVLNKKILVCKDKATIDDITLPIRLKSLKLDKEPLSSAELNKIITSIGTISGHISSRIIGTKGFGYDPIFVPNGSKITFGQMNLQKKMKIDHRSIAFKKLKKKLKLFKFFI